MAENKKTRTNLDYGLSQGTLQALADAQKAQLAKEGVGSAASVWGKALSNIGAQASLLDQQKKTEEELEKQEAELEKDIRDEAEINYRNSWYNTETGNWTTNDTFKQLNAIEEDFLDEYLNELDQGNNVEANNILNGQTTRYTNLGHWQESVLFASKINSQDPDSKHLQFSNSMSDKDKYILQKINEQGPDVKINWNKETGQYEFTIPPDDSGLKAHPGGVITLADYNKITENLVPLDFRNEWGTDQNAIYKSVMDGKMTNFDSEIYFGENIKKINEKNIKQLYTDDVFQRGGRTFVEDLELHPDFDLVNISALMESKGIDLDTGGMGEGLFDADIEGDDDGWISPDEMVNLSADDRRNIIDLLLEEDEKGNLINFELAQAYLAEYMTMMQNSQFKASILERNKESKRKRKLK